MTGKAKVLQVGPPAGGGLRPAAERFALETASAGAGIGGVATNGKEAIGAPLLDRLPDLAIVSCLGAGTDALDMHELARYGIAVATTASVLAADVADVAIGLVIALARDFRRADRFVRTGGWQAGKHPLGHAVSGARLGVLGLGAIGSAVARRAEGVRHGNRLPQPRPARGHRRVHEVVRRRAARASNHEEARATSRIFLIWSTGAAVCSARSALVNVARGSVVDEPALVVALEGGRIAGAGLDVFAAEPAPHAALLARNDVVLLPHIGRATVETRDAMARAVIGALVNALAAG